MNNQKTRRLLSEKQIALRRSLAAFFIPMAVLCLAFAAQNVFPFGQRHILTVDLYHQYAPFLGELRAKLLSASSLFFSWRGGLGINFFSLFAYYSASPLNLITLLFPESMLSEMVLCLVLLKSGLASLFFHLFLKKAYQRDGPLAVAFASAYALNAYVLAYYWNIMWLDTVALLPLLALSLVTLIRRGRTLPYILCLGLVVYSNYYSGFFACVFIGLYFWLLLERFGAALLPSAKVAASVRFLLSSLLGTALAMLTVLPTIYTLQNTSAAGDKFPDKISSFEPFVDFIARLLPLSPPSIRSGMANLYVGSFVIILLYLFLRSRDIPPLRKFLQGSLLFFLILSFNNNFLNFLWHGMHYPNQLPYRNSFVFCFFVLSLAYDVLPSLQRLPAFLLGGFTFWFAALLLLLQKVDKATYKDSVLLFAFLALLCYAAFFKKFMHNGRQPGRPLSPFRQREKMRVYTLMLSTLILAEISINAFFAIQQVATNEYFGYRDKYMVGEEPAAIRRLLKKHEFDNGPNCLTRTEILPDHSVNDAMLYRSNGLTIFSSTYPEKNVHALAALGFPNNGINSFQYQGSTPVADALLGIRYLIRRETSKLDERVCQIVDRDGQLTLWENPYSLPFAYIGKAGILPGEGPDYQAFPSGNPFSTQASLLNQLSGSTAPVFVEVQDFAIKENSEKGLSIKNNQESNSFEVQRNETGNGSFGIDVPIAEEGNYYVFWKFESMGIANAYLDISGERERLGSKSQNIASLGWQEAGSTLNLEFEFGDNSKSKTSGLNFRVAKLNENVLADSISRIRERSVEFLEMGSRSFRLKTEAGEDSSLFVAASYDPGWRAFIDDQEVRIQRIYEGFMGVPLPAGSHTLSFVFTPVGFTSGLAVSLTALLLTLILAVWEWHQGNRGAAAELPSFPGQKKKRREQLIPPPAQVPASSGEEQDEGSHENAETPRLP